MRGRETAANDLARRLVLVALGMTFFALAALMWPGQASAQSQCAGPGCRPLCVSGFDAHSNSDTPLYTLTALKAGAGDGTFAVTALNPYTGASYNSPANKVRECATRQGTSDVWDVKHWCTFHCEHRHYFVQPAGLPQPATARVTATANATSFFLGWTPASGCAPPGNVSFPKLACVLRVDGNKTVTGNFGTSADATPPTAPVISLTSMTGNAAAFAIDTPATDAWLAGYEVFVTPGSPSLRTRIRADAETFTISNLLCNRNHAFWVQAYDSANATASNTVNATTGACPRVAPNGVFHVKPPLRTKKRTAFFHWGARRGGVDLPQRSFKSKCRVDRKIWRTCSAVSGKTVRNLTPGRWHTFRVKVGDAQGWDQTPAVWRWRVRR